LVISIVAVTIAVVMPLATYKWMQNDVRIQRMKASSLRAASKAASSTSTTVDPGYVHKTVFVRITNDGELPVGRVEVILEHDGMERGFFQNTKVTAKPYYDVRSKVCDSAFVATLEKPLPPGEVVTLIFSNRFELGHESELLAWVRSEASPAVPIQGLPGRREPTP
jgi:hypothetical protein